MAPTSGAAGCGPPLPQMLSSSASTCGSSTGGRGYASEAARAAIAHAFGALGIRQLVAGHHPVNRASRQLLERLGFRYLSDDLYPPTGLRHPTYALRPEDVDGS